MPAHPRRRLGLFLLLSALLHLSTLLLAQFWPREHKLQPFHVRLALAPPPRPPYAAPRRRPAPRTPQRKDRFVLKRRPGTPRFHRRLEPLKARMPELEAILRSLPSAAALLGRSIAFEGRPPVPRDSRAPSERRRGSKATEALALSLLRLEDLARSDRLHGLVIPGPERQQLRGFVHLARLRTYGAGTGILQRFGDEAESEAEGGNARLYRQYMVREGIVDQLAEFVRRVTPIEASVRQRPFDYFVNPHLLEYPIHFLFEEGGLRNPDKHSLTQFRYEELEMLGRYLRQGGFLFIEGGPRFLDEMVVHLQKALYPEGRLFAVPYYHQLYHAYYDFNRGFPQEPRWKEESSHPLRKSYSLPGPGLWGVELKGDLVAVLSPLYLHEYWDEDLAAEIDASLGNNLGDGLRYLFLRAGTNVVLYALTRPRGLSARLEHLAFEAPRRPPTPPGPAPEAVNLSEVLPASLALLPAPGARADVPMRLRLDGRSLLRGRQRSAGGLLLHNLPAGAHGLEVEYGGKRRKLDLVLQQDSVATVTFALRHRLFKKQLRLVLQREYLNLEAWRAKFSDVAFKEIYLLP